MFRVLFGFSGICFVGHLISAYLQQSTKNELQKETMFLGVNLFDRFLTKGYFRNKKNLQIAGIACLTLATRIEENQPLNRLGSPL